MVTIWISVSRPCSVIPRLLQIFGSYFGTIGLWQHNLDYGNIIWIILWCSLLWPVIVVWLQHHSYYRIFCFFRCLNGIIFSKFAFALLDAGVLGLTPVWWWYRILLGQMILWELILGLILVIPNLFYILLSKHVFGMYSLWNL